MWRKQTKSMKSENISVIFDFELQTVTKEQWTEETAAIAKKKSIVPDGDGLPNKRLSYKKCFVPPLVDSKVNPKS